MVQMTDFLRIGATTGTVGMSEMTLMTVMTDILTC